MKAVKVKTRYRGTVTYGGTNHTVDLNPGDVFDAEEWLIELVNHEVPGTLELLEVRRAAQYKEGTKKAKASKTRQVTKSDADR